MSSLRDRIIDELKSICRTKTAEYPGEVKWCGDCKLCQEKAQTILTLFEAQKDRDSKRYRQEPNPCPRCGSSNLEVGDDWVNYSYVYCKNCKYEHRMTMRPGGIPDYDGVIKEWNQID